MVEYTVIAYDLDGDLPNPGGGTSFTYDTALHGSAHGLVVEDDDEWVETASAETGASATYVSDAGEPGWATGDTVTFTYVQVLTGDDGSTIVMGWLQNTASGTYQMMTDEPLVDGVTYTEVYSEFRPSSAQYSWAMFNSHAPCFTRGMEIRTDRGPIAVENLVAGDMIWTLDHGYQELKFLNSTHHFAVGPLTPVLFKRGTIWNTKDLIVSQKHRFLISKLPKRISRRFGEHTDTLLQAHCLCDGHGIRLYPEIGTVEYFHLMFDNHELLDCYGTISESWQPTRKAIRRNPELAEELNAIFPGIAERRLSDPGGLVRNEVVFAMPEPGQPVNHP